jgi:hypothetical protein
MSDSDYERLSEWLNVGGGMTPFNETAHDLLEQSHKGEVFTFLEMTNRDLKFHRCFMSLLNYIYDYMPPEFKRKVIKKYFYRYLKHLKGKFEVILRFEDGTTMIEYESISFGRMSQKTFENYIRDQLPWIYSDVLGEYFEGDMLTGIIDTIEEEYKKFLAKL